MADDFADEILRDMTIEQIAAKAVDSEQSDGYSHDTELAIATRAACIAARRAITLTRVRTLRESATKVCSYCEAGVKYQDGFHVHSHKYVFYCRAEPIRAEADRIERQMREDGK